MSKLCELWTTNFFQLYDEDILLIRKKLSVSELGSWTDKRGWVVNCASNVFEVQGLTSSTGAHAVNAATTNSEPYFSVFMYVCSLTSHSRACSIAGGPCSNRSRWARLNTRRTWRRSRARSARSRAAGSGRRWETRSPHTTPPLPCTPDLEGAHQCVDRQTEAGQKPGYGAMSPSLPHATSL